MSSSALLPCRIFCTFERLKFVRSLRPAEKDGIPFRPTLTFNAAAACCAFSRLPRVVWDSVAAGTDSSCHCSACWACGAWIEARLGGASDSEAEIGWRCWGSMEGVSSTTIVRHRRKKTSEVQLYRVNILAKPSGREAAEGAAQSAVICLF